MHHPNLTCKSITLIYLEKLFILWPYMVVWCQQLTSKSNSDTGDSFCIYTSLYRNLHHINTKTTFKIRIVHHTGISWFEWNESSPSDQSETGIQRVMWFNSLGYFSDCLLTGHFVGVPRHWAGDIILSRCCDDYPGAHAVLEIHYRPIVTGPLARRQYAPVAMGDDGGIRQGRKVAAVKDLDPHLHLWK